MESPVKENGMHIHVDTKFFKKERVLLMNKRMLVLLVG